MEKNLKIIKLGEYINEAVIRTEKVHEYINKIFQYVNNRTDNYNPYDADILVRKIVDNKEEVLKGRLFLGFDHSAFRINWKNTGTYDNIVSIDFWEKYKLDQNLTPNYTMYIFDSIVPILPVIAEFIIDPSKTMAKHNAQKVTEEILFEYYDDQETETIVEPEPKPNQSTTSNTNTDQKKVDTNIQFYTGNEIIDKMGVDARKKGKEMAIKNYQNASSKADKAKYKELAQTYAFSLGESEVILDKTSTEGISNDLIFDPFYAIEEHTYAVASGESNSLLITGLGGLGKTFEVEKTLNDMGLVEDKDYEKISGGITTASLYEKLYKNRNGLLVFDDCDSFWGDEEASNYLKAALDTKKVRVISRVTKNSFDTKGMSEFEIEQEWENSDRKKLPEKIKYTGRIIFISNLDVTDIDGAVFTRVLHVDVKLTREEVIERMNGILPHMRTDIPMDLRLMVYHFLQDVTMKYRFKFALNMRTLHHCFSILQGQRKKNPDKNINDVTRPIKRLTEEGETINEVIPTWQYLCHMFLVSDDKERSKKAAKNKKEKKQG